MGIGLAIMLKRLRELREAQFWSQQDLADKAGVSRVTISRLETGLEAARPSTARKLAEALGVKPRELVGEG